MEKLNFVLLITLAWVVVCMVEANSVASSFSSSSARVKRADPIRCSLTNGFFCRWTCRGLGHSDGHCDLKNDECMCSEQDLEKFVCGGDVGNKTADHLCAGWCQFKGKQSGDCDTSIGECKCTEDVLEGEHAKCITDTICSFYCQFKERKATGECTGKNGWDCVCLSNTKHNELHEK